MRSHPSVKKHSIAQYNLTQVFFKVILSKSISTQFRRLILYSSNSKGQIDGFFGEF